VGAEDGVCGAAGILVVGVLLLSASIFHYPTMRLQCCAAGKAPRSVAAALYTQAERRWGLSFVLALTPPLPNLCRAIREWAVAVTAG